MRTSWTEVRKSYGLLPPFNVRIAIPFLLNMSFLGVIVLICAFFLLRGELNFGTARFYFFLYLAALLIVGAIFSKARKLPYVILVWCVIELGLGLGSNLASDSAGDNSIFPQNAAIDTSPSANIYHPLLQSVPRPNYRYSRRMDFGDLAATAKAAGVDVASLQGQEVAFVHNSLGLRGKELTADDLARPLIFAYGGSTTYDSSVTQGQTWVERLQSDLNNNYTIVNWGAAAYDTVEGLLQTAFYQDVAGKKPECAIYYGGWTDMDEAHMEHLDGGYADFHLLNDVDRKDPLFLAQFSPLLLLVNALAVRRFDSVPFPPHQPGQSPIAGGDERLEAIFAQHIQTIVAINKARGIKTILIRQIYNRSWPTDPTRNFLHLVRAEDKALWGERFKSILKDIAASTGVKYIDPGIANFGGSDFVDSVHFAAQGSGKFAALISKQVGDYCQ